MTNVIFTVIVTQYLIRNLSCFYIYVYSIVYSYITLYGIKYQEYMYISGTFYFLHSYLPTNYFFMMHTACVRFNTFLISN